MSMQPLVGIVGDFNSRNHTHVATNEALAHVGLAFEWVDTDAVGDDAAARLARYAGLWIAPASPYRSMEGRSGPCATPASGASRSSGPEGASSTRSSSSRATSSGSRTPTTPRRTRTRIAPSSRRSPVPWSERPSP